MSNTANFFNSIDDAIAALKDQQAELGFAISKRSNYQRRKGVRIILECARSGPYRQRPNYQGKKASTTKKCNCPAKFAVNGIEGGFTTEVLHAEHNHETDGEKRSTAAIRRATRSKHDQNLIKERIMEYTGDGLPSRKIATLLEREFHGLIMEPPEVRHIRRDYLREKAKAAESAQEVTST